MKLVSVKLQARSVQTTTLLKESIQYEGTETFYTLGHILAWSIKKFSEKKIA